MGALNWRPFAFHDLEECLRLCDPNIGEELVGRARAFAAWRWLVQQRSFNSAVVQDSKSGTILGFGASVFVTTEFATSEIRSPQPGLNARLIASIDRREPAVLTLKQLGRLNAAGMLDLVILCSAWQAGLQPTVVEEIVMLLPCGFADLHEGYRLQRMVYEAIGERHVTILRATPSFRSISQYKEYFQTYPDSPFRGVRELAMVNRESTLAEPGTVGMPLFFHRDPVLGLTDSDQVLLLAALRDSSDEAIATKLNLSVAAVRWRWAQLFARVSSVRPDLVEPQEGSTRGTEKRSRILEYVRQHREELRPFDSTRV